MLADALSPAIITVQMSMSKASESSQCCSYPYHTGLAHNIICDGQNLALDASLPILGNIMRAGGYATHAVGKWDVRV